MKIGSYNVQAHAVAVHFTNALYPVALFFLILSYFYQKDFSSFAYFHLMILATLSSLVSHVTGIVDWKQKYKGARIRIFMQKKRYALILIGLGTLCTIWYAFYPEIAHDQSGGHFVFLLLNFALLPVVVYLGYLGGKLVFQCPHE